MDPNFVGRLKRMVGRGARRVRAGDERLASHKLAPNVEPSLTVTSPDFEDGEALPRAATIEGEGVPPALEVSGVPAEAKSLAVLCEDPDAPMAHPFLHWSVYWLEGRDQTIDAEVVATAAQGKNSTLEIGFTPANPPKGHGVHHYHFEVFALDYPLPGSPDDVPGWEGEQPGEGVMMGSGRNELFEAMRGHVVAWGEIVGVYEAP